MRYDNRQQHGFTLVELTIILMVLVILSAILLPQMGGFNRLARYVRVKEDLGAICSVLKQMLDDVGEGTFYADPGPDHIPRRDHLPIGLLVGDGDIPIGPTDSDDSRFEWTRPVAAQFSIPTDGGCLDPTFVVDRLANHLVHNTPLGDGRHRWRGPLDAMRGFNSLFAWRGPYMDDPVVSDPWGNRYMANVFALYNPPSAGALERYASGVVCFSAGLDSEVDTAFNQPFGWATDDDDLAVVLSAGGPI